MAGGERQAGASSCGHLSAQLLISEHAIQLLDESEMQAAIRHEVAYASFHDNFKKLVLRISQFPFLPGLEWPWMHAAEVAADDAADGSVQRCRSLDVQCR